MTGLYYPVEVAFGDTDLAAQLPYQSKFIVWSGSNYVSFARTGRAAPGTWTTEALSTLIEPAEGFWIQSGTGSSVLWQETRPFTP
jgi:hypothetical protein